MELKESLESYRSQSLKQPVKSIHSYARIEGVDLHWAEVGTIQTRTPIVLLHGLGDSHLTWKRILPYLATDRRVLIPDLPGHGLSASVEASYELNWHAQLIAQWIATQGIEKFDVLGHSFGGGVAQVLLLKSSPRINRLVLASSGGLGQEVGYWLRLASLPYIVERFGQPFMGLGTRLVMLRLRKHLSPGEFAEIIKMNERPGSARTFSRTVRDVINLRGQTKGFFHRMQEIKDLPPIAVIWGGRDKVIPPKHGKTFAEIIEGVRFTELDRCGHYPHQEEPEEFAKAVRNFLDMPNLPPAKIRS